MSSAKNHRIRSHKSYHTSIATTEHFRTKQYMKTAQQYVFGDNLFTKLMDLFKKGDK